METVAYYIALVMTVVSPPMILTWFLVHPFAHWWRRVGVTRTYIILGTLIIMTMAGIFAIREPLLKVHYGVKMPLVALSAVLFAIAMYIGFRLRRHLSVRAMIGVPEVSPDEKNRRLITEGIYSRIRHPRYVEVGFGVAATALFTNYLICYILFLVYIPTIYFVVLIEERELRQRFGKAYDDYCRTVPRFIPELNARKEKS